ncbi:MAG: hypothetical protein WCF84_27310 [Anaerolineae bacterium]
MPTPEELFKQAEEGGKIMGTGCNYIIYGLFALAALVVVAMVCMSGVVAWNTLFH